MAYNPNEDGGGYDDGRYDQPAPAAANWWEGPPPQGYSGPWPPPLAPGASYGPNFGQIVYGAPTPAEETPGYTPPTETTESPYSHPEYWNQQPPPPVPVVGPPPPVVGPPPPGPGVYTSPGAQAGVPTSGFGGAPATYQSNPGAPQYEPMEPYRPPQWTGGDFVNPTEQELYATPGYQSRLSDRLRASTRRHAAGGTILNGGTLRALDREGQDYATNEYQNLRSNSLENYRNRYSQFQDAAGMDLGARTLNANEHQNTFANRTATYLQGNQRTLSDYLTQITAKRNSELDMWQRLQDLNQTGANLAGGSR